MTAATISGIPQHTDVEGAIAPSSREEMDRALDELSAKKDEWVALPIPDRRAILREIVKDFARVADAWADKVREAEGIPEGTATAGEEWLAGPYFIIRNARLLEEALGDVATHGRPRIPGPVEKGHRGQVTARVFPQTIYDRIFFTGIEAEVWMEPDVTVESLPGTQAVAYKTRDLAGAVCLVLGAGNVSSIGPMDTLYKVFVEKKVVLYKAHPLNAYLGPLLAEGFQALVDWGVLRIVYGGAEVGEYLCNHDGVDEIHITGSDKTVEAIVFGPGEEGELRKKQRRPRNTKPISSELGNVSPVIVVPGPWSDKDFAYHSENLASMLTNNAGFNCNATRVIVQHKRWRGRKRLLDGVREVLAGVPTRKAYYPGAAERHAAFVDAHPEAERFGEPGSDELPWTLVADVDPAAEDDVCFRTEAFCSVFSETALDASSVPEYVAKAVELANETLWGTLSASILVHPASLEDPEIAEAVDNAVADLRYGTVALNSWSALGYGLVVTPWGAYPGHDVYDVQSGSGVVHNTLMFSRPQKTVVRTPFRMSPKPLWFPSHKTALGMGKKLTRFETSPSPLVLPGIIWDALRG